MAGILMWLDAPRRLKNNRLEERSVSFIALAKCMPLNNKAVSNMPVSKVTISSKVTKGNNTTRSVVPHYFSPIVRRQAVGKQLEEV